MKKGIKIALGIGIPLGTLAVLYFAGKSKAKKNGCVKTKFGATIYGFPLCSEEDEDKYDDYEDVTETSSSSASTPFKNNSEGNSFRLWVNVKYPSYAKQIDLDSTGSYDNKFIGEAFTKYGAEYLKADPRNMVNHFLGSRGATWEKDNVSLKFDLGTIKFYTNGRYLVFDKAGKTIQKGNYYSGGRELISTEGINKGKTFIDARDVFKNIQNALKGKSPVADVPNFFNKLFGKS